MTARGTFVKIHLVLAGIAHLVERHLAKVEVASSSLVARSKKEIPIQIGWGFPFWSFPIFVEDKNGPLRRADQNRAGEKPAKASPTHLLAERQANSGLRLCARSEMGQGPANAPGVCEMPGSESALSGAHLLVAFLNERFSFPTAALKVEKAYNGWKDR